MGVIDPARARAMIEKRAATQARNRAEAEAGRRYRDTDELERAKRYLRRQGFRVFSESVDGRGGDMIYVGTVRMTSAAVIEKAAEHQNRAARK